MVYAEDITDGDDTTVVTAKPKTVTAKEPDYESLRPYFLQVPKEKVVKTFRRSTQYGLKATGGYHLGQTFKSPFPALNVWRRNEPVASDAIFAETPAINGGQTMAQFYCGRKSLVIDIFGMNTEKEFVNTLLDVI